MTISYPNDYTPTAADWAKTLNALHSLRGPSTLREIMACAGIMGIPARRALDELKADGAVEITFTRPTLYTLTPDGHALVEVGL